MTKIILIGHGGEGIKLLGQIIGNYLTILGFNLTLMFSYDSSIRNGDIVAFLKFNHKKIENPLISRANLIVQLSNSNKTFDCDKLIVNNEVTKFAANYKNIIKLPLRDKHTANIMMFGYLIKELGLELKEKEIAKILPPKLTKSGIKTVKFGYEQLH